MIQRIQSIYLLIVTGLLIATMCLPVGQFIASDGVTAYIFKPLGVTLTEDTFQSTWGLFGILFLSAVVAFCTIFLFRNRMLQVRMTVFNSILLIGYYAAFFVFMFMLKDDLDAMTFQLGWALCLPAISIILNYLSFRAIYRDEVMVKAADRLRAPQDFYIKVPGGLLLSILELFFEIEQVSYLSHYSAMCRT